MHYQEWMFVEHIILKDWDICSMRRMRNAKAAFMFPLETMLVPVNVSTYAINFCITA